MISISKEEDKFIYLQILKSPKMETSVNPAKFGMQ